MKYAALYPRMWAHPGEKCLHEQRRHGRLTLVCCRLKGHEARGEQHLHDVPPELQVVQDEEGEPEPESEESFFDKAERRARDYDDGIIADDDH